MYMRLVQVKVKPEAIPNLQRLYEEKIIPVLHRMPGCLQASLIRSVHHVDECVSMTLWDRKEHAEAYEKSGAFSSLVKEAAPYLAGSSEWKINLSEDLTLKYEPEPEEPVVTAYNLTI